MACKRDILFCIILTLPHNDANEPHDNFTENIEEVDHDLCLLLHVPNDDAKCCAERNDTCNTHCIVLKNYSIYVMHFVKDIRTYTKSRMLQALPPFPLLISYIIQFICQSTKNCFE